MGKGRVERADWSSRREKREAETELERERWAGPF